MKTNLFIIVVIAGTISACTLEGVKADINQNSNDSIHNTIDTLSPNLLSNTVEAVKPDTLISGETNDMVWSNSQGLRIEWKQKQTKVAINQGDAIFVNYEARVARGEVYDSNTEIGRPVPLKLGMGQIVKGWETALLNMHIGDIGRIMIPSALGYGEQGYLGKVPRHADIIVEIEIVAKIEPIVLSEGVKVFKYFKGDTSLQTPIKNQNITFDYFAFKKGKEPGMYDNSYKKGASFTVRFKNDNVVDGLHQGLEVLRKGDKAFIDIPSNLAYHKKGLQDLVPPNTDIVFDVRIQEIK